MSRQAIRLVLVDDHELIRAGVRAELTRRDAATEPTIDVVGEAGSVEDAVDVIRRTRPDVVLLDVHLPGGGGRAVIEGLTSDKLPTRFLALSVSDAADDVIGVVRAGARGYVTKSISPADLQTAIGRVHDGDAVFSPRLAGFVLDAFAGDELVKGQGTAGDPDLDRLTRREREVMRLIARGFSYKEIASRLFLSAKTVETHVSAVLRKLQLSNRHQLTAWANERRLV
jgi:DNA-binding NarL/FixJ family response regulator